MLFCFNLFELLESKILPRRWLSKASPLTARKPAAALIKTRPWHGQHSLHSGKHIRPPAFWSLRNQKCGIDQAQALPTPNHVGPRAVLGLGMGQELIGHAAAPGAQMAIRPPRSPSAALGILCKTPCRGLHAGSGDPLPCLPRQLLALAFKRRLVPHPDLHPSHWARICSACLAHCGYHRPALKAKCLPRSGAGLASPASLKGPAGCPKG